jgi:hypothetical protein
MRMRLGKIMPRRFEERGLCGSSSTPGPAGLLNLLRQGFDGGRRQAFWIALAFRRQVHDPPGDQEGGAVLVVNKAKMMKHSTIRDGKSRYIIKVERVTALPKHAGDWAGLTPTVELADCS